METTSQPYHSANAPLDFGFDVNTVDTGYPIIPSGTYKATIQKVDVKDKADGQGQVLKVTFVIDQEVTAESGALIPPGFHKLSKSYSLDPEHVSFILRLHDAVHGSKKGTRPPVVPNEWEGKSIALGVSIDAERTDPKTGREYARSNNVATTSYLRQ